MSRTSPLSAALLLGVAFLSSACPETPERTPFTIPQPTEPDASMDAGTADTAEQDASDASEDVGVDAEPDAEPWPEEVIGALNLTYWSSDARYPYPELHAHAVFSPALATLDVLDPVGLLNASRGLDVYVYDDYFVLPASGESRDVIEPPEFEGDLGLLDAGGFVAVGEELVANQLEELVESDPELIVYESLDEEAARRAEEELIDAPLDLEIDGGEDVPGVRIEDALVLPEPWTITSHDVSEPLPVRYGQELVITWEPGSSADDIVLMTLETFDAARVWRIEDEGRVDVTALARDASFVIGAPEELTIALTRVRTVDLPTPGGVVRARSSRKVWFYPQTVEPFGVAPGTWRVGGEVDATVRWADGVFPVGATVDVGPGVVVSDVVWGDSVGHALAFTATVDPGAPTGPREVVVRAADGTEALRLPGRLYVVGELPGQGVCEDAVEEGFVGDGAYVASDGGLDWGLFSSEVCWGGDPEGREQVVPLQLQAGQRLRAELTHPDVPGALYIVGSCDDLAEARACSGAPRKGRAAELTYTAFDDEDVLLVVDSYGSEALDPADYVVNIERASAAFAVEPDYMTSGARETLFLYAFGGDFDETASFDFGPEVVVEDARVFGNFAEVDVRAAEPMVDPSVDLTASVGGVSSTLSDALYVANYIGGPASCVDADAAGALAPGSYEGITFTGGQGATSVTPCKQGEAEGREAIFRIELGPSETLRARAAMQNQDVVLYVVEACGGPAMTCSDDTGFGRPEYVEWTGPATPSVVYLVVDGFAPEDDDAFLLEVEVGK